MCTEARDYVKRSARRGGTEVSVRITRGGDAKITYCSLKVALIWSKSGIARRGHDEENNKRCRRRRGGRGGGCLHLITGLCPSHGHK